LEHFVQSHLLSISDSPLVLAIDEADRLLQTDFYNDFFGLLRGWYNLGAEEGPWKKLSIVLVISTEPHLFIRDLHQSPFNVGLPLNLQDFNEAQVRILNQRYGTPVQEDDLPKLMHLCNGHPYLTRKALYTMAVRKLTWADLTRLAATDNSPFADHLNHQYHLLSNNSQLKKALKQLIHAQRRPTEPALTSLLRAGLVKKIGQTYMPRCELYRLYFERKL
jgi:hypothetical protein